MPHLFRCALIFSCAGSNLLEERVVLRWLWMRTRLQESVDVREFLVRDDLDGEWRHLARRLANVAEERVEWNRVRCDAGAAHRRALAFTAMAFVTANFVEELLAVFGVACRRVGGLWLLRRVRHFKLRGNEENRNRDERESSGAFWSKGFHVCSSEILISAA